MVWGSVRILTCATKFDCARPIPKVEVLLLLKNGLDRKAFAAVLEATLGLTGNVANPDK